MDEEDGQDYPEFLLPLWSHETLLVLLPCSLSLQPRPNLTTRIMRLAATISRNLFFSNLGLLGIHLLLFFRVRHVCLRMITMIDLITCTKLNSTSDCDHSFLAILCILTFIVIALALFPVSGQIANPLPFLPP